MWQYIDPVIIEEEKKKNVDDRPQLELPVPEYYPIEEPEKEDTSEQRGVYIIEIF